MQLYNNESFKIMKIFIFDVYGIKVVLAKNVFRYSLIKKLHFYEIFYCVIVRLFI